MDGGLSRAIGARSRAVIALGVLLFTQPVGAQGLTDPTRPPDAQVQGPGQPEATAPDGVAVDAGPVLQSVIQSGTRQYAMISGKSYKMGDAVAGARIIAISETEVTLRDGKQRVVLKMFPGIEKKPSASAMPPVVKKPAVKKTAVKKTANNNKMTGRPNP